MKLLRVIFGEPLAAPEDRLLRGLRLSILGACIMVAGIMAGLGPLRAAFGNLPALMVAAALVAPAYVRIKTRRDGEHLDCLGAELRAREGVGAC